MKHKIGANKTVVLALSLAWATASGAETRLITETPSVNGAGMTGNATLQGAVTTDGGGVSSWFQWGQGAVTNRVEAIEIGDWDGTSYLMAALTNLQAGMRYHYRVAASDGTNTFYGAEQTFGIPKLTLLGNNPMGITLGGTYAEPGATATEPPLQISAGNTHTLLLRPDGTVSAWGGNTYGQTNVPALATNIVAIAAGDYHSVALRGDGTVVAWGSNNYGETNVTGTDVIAVAAGSYHTLALRNDGIPVGWGTFASYNLTTIPASATNVVAIAAGYRFDLALREDGTVVAWGDPLYATRITGATNIVAISAGGYGAVGLKKDGTIVVWGGVGPSETNDIVAIRSGSSALRADGTLITWGGTNNTAPIDATNIVDWTVGKWHCTVMRSDGSLISWGDNTYGQTNCPTAPKSLDVDIAGDVNEAFPGNYTISYQASDIYGTPAQTTRNVVVYKAPEIAVPIVSAQKNGTTINADATARITPNGLSTEAWLSWFGAPGTNQASQRTALGGGNSPVSLNASLGNLKSSQSYLCQALTSNAYETMQSSPVAIWAPNVLLVGSTSITNTFGQTFTEPGKYATGQPLAVGVTELYSLALRADGTVVTTGGDIRAPSGLSNLVAIAAGGGHVVGLRRDGTGVSWGFNNYGQTNAPKVRLTAIGAGYHHSLGVRPDGTVVAWGLNNYGQCNVPKGLRGVKAVAGGTDFSVALKHDGTVLAWGTNSNGQLTIPASATNISAIAAGSYHVLAARKDGTVLAWGLNNYGQCNVPANANGAVGVAAGSAQSVILKTNGYIISWGDSRLVRNINASHTAIGAGYRHAIAVSTNGSCTVWGDRMTTDTIFEAPADRVTLSVTRNGDTVNPGVHTLTYSVTNEIGAVATATRTLTVMPPPTETMPVSTITQSSSSGTVLTLTNTAGRTITVLGATNITAPLSEWQPLGTMTENPGGYFQFTDPAGTNSASRFYRFRSP